MSDNESPAETAWWHPDELLGPGPSAMVAFVLAALVLWGGGLMINAAQSVFAADWFSSQSDMATYYAVWSLGSFIPAVASLFLARRAIIDVRTLAWELTLARSAAVLAVVGIGYTVILLIGAAIHLD